MAMYCWPVQVLTPFSTSLPPLEDILPNPFSFLQREPVNDIDFTSKLLADLRHSTGNTSFDTGQQFPNFPSRTPAPPTWLPSPPNSPDSTTELWPPPFGRPAPCSISEGTRPNFKMPRSRRRDNVNAAEYVDTVVDAIAFWKREAAKRTLIQLCSWFLARTQETISSLEQSSSKLMVPRDGAAAFIKEFWARVSVRMPRYRIPPPSKHRIDDPQVEAMVSTMRALTPDLNLSTRSRIRVPLEDLPTVIEQTLQETEPALDKQTREQIDNAKRFTARLNDVVEFERRVGGVSRGETIRDLLGLSEPPEEYEELIPEQATEDLSHFLLAYTRSIAEVISGEDITGPDLPRCLGRYLMASLRHSFQDHYRANPQSWNTFLQSYPGAGSLRQFVTSAEPRRNYRWLRLVLNAALHQRSKGKAEVALETFEGARWGRWLADNGDRPAELAYEWAKRPQKSWVYSVNKAMGVLRRQQGGRQEDVDLEGVEDVIIGDDDKDDW